MKDVAKRKRVMQRDEWRDRRNELLDRLREWRGELPARGPLEVAETSRREYHSHTEIALTYAGEPGERIPAYLLLPRDPVAMPTPGILAAHQCACQCDIGKEQVVGKCVDLPDQAYGLELVCEGFAVLAPDANKVGERYDPELREQWQCAFEDLPDQTRCCCAPGAWAASTSAFPWPARWASSAAMACSSCSLSSIQLSVYRSPVHEFTDFLGLIVISLLHLQRPL